MLTFIECQNLFRQICKRADLIGNDFSFSIEELQDITSVSKPYGDVKRKVKKLVRLKLLFRYSSCSASGRYGLPYGYQKTLAYFLCFPEKFIKLPDSDVNDDIDCPY